MADYSYPPPVPQGLIPVTPLRDGKAPKRRIPDAATAQTIVVNLWNANLQRNVQWAAMQGQIDGNPPYSPAKLRAMGRANDPNVNTLEAKAIRSAALVPYFDLFAGGNRYVEIRLSPPGMEDYENGAGTSNSPRYNGQSVNGSPTDPNYDPVRLSEDSGIASEEYDRMLRRWRNFERTMNTGITDYVAFGRCHLPWESHDSWRFRRIAFQRVMVPDATPVDDEEWEMIIVLNSWTVSRLYKMVREEDEAESTGWNVDEVMSAIAGAVPVDPAIPNNPMQVQQMVKDADLYVSARSATVQTATIYVREFNGKWSELMVRRDQIPGPIGGSDNAPRNANFLYESYDKYDCVDEIMANFFFEVNDGTWNGASGLARDVFSLMQLKDRTFCAMMHSAFLRSSLVLQPRQALDKTRMNLIQFGALTVIPENFEVHDSQILGDITSTIEVSREMGQMVERNTGIYRPTLEKTPGNPDTLGEFQAKFAQATVLSTSAINRFYSQLDRLYCEQWKRVIECGMRSGGESEYEKEAQMFVQRCEARGVSREQLKRLDYIRAFRNIGQGSQAMRQQTLQNFMPLYPLLPANGQENLLEDIIRTAGSQFQVERYLPDADRRKLPSDQLAYALLENAALRSNAPVSWTPSQNNIIHAQTHLQAGAQAAQSLQAGADPHDVASFLDVIGQHTAIHIQREAQNPTSKNAVKVLTQQWKQLATVADKLKQAIQAAPEQQQQLNEQAQQLMSDQKVKLLDVQLKNQLSTQKAQGLLTLKAQRQQQELALKAQKQAADTALAARQQQIDANMAAQETALDAQLADAETAVGVQLSTAKTAADIAHARAKTAADIENQRKKAEQTATATSDA